MHVWGLLRIYTMHHYTSRKDCCYTVEAMHACMGVSQGRLSVDTCYLTLALALLSGLATIAGLFLAHTCTVGLAVTLEHLFIAL